MFSLSGAKEWHNRGYKGKGVKVLVVEPDTTNYHGLSVANKAEIYSPEHTLLTYKHEPFCEKYMFDYAIANGVHIINMSYGCNYGEQVEEMMKKEYRRALDRGIIIVKSAGNDGEEGTSDNGKVDERIINVGMVDENLKRVAESSYDSIGTVDCCGIVGDRLKDGTILWGTSEAAPYVTGLIACLLSKEKMTVNQVNQFIAKHSMDIGEVGKDNKTGYGVFRLPSFDNPLSVKMINRDGKQLFVHKDFVKSAIDKGYTGG